MSSYIVFPAAAMSLSDNSTKERLMTARPNDGLSAVVARCMKSLWIQETGLAIDAEK